MLRQFTLLLLLFLPTCLSANTPDYRKADSIALSLSGRKITNAELLVKLLTQELETEEEKARAIFRWITANIQYDKQEADRIIKTDFKPTNKRFKSAADAHKWQEKRYYKKVTSALRKRKAVCEGYAMLFKHLCSWANIEAEVVGGHYRSHTLKIGKYYKPTHAWNAVRLNGKWQLLDATMASGYIEPMTEKFIRDFSDVYFLPPPEIMVTTHYPEENRWLLMTNQPTVKSFYKRPISMEGFFRKKLSSVFPEEGIIRAEPDETVIIRFNTANQIPITSLYCQIERGNRDKKAVEKRYLPSRLVRISEKEYEVHICFPKKGNFRFYMLLDKEPALLYQAVIRPAQKTKK